MSSGKPPVSHSQISWGVPHPMVRHFCSAIFLLFSVVGELPGSLEAQSQVEVEPYVGLYRPTSILASGDGFAADAGDTVKHQGSVALGMRVTISRLGRRLGFEGTFGYAPSALWSNLLYDGPGVPTYAAHVITLSAKASLRVTPPDVRTGLRVSAGVSLVGHGGDAYPTTDYTGPRTFLGGIAGLGGSVRLGRWLGLRIDGEDFVYSAHLGKCTRTGPGSGSVCDVYSENANRGPTGSRLQNDLVLSLGFSLNLTELNRAPNID